MIQSASPRGRLNRMALPSPAEIERCRRAIQLNWSNEERTRRAVTHWAAPEDRRYQAHLQFVKFLLSTKES